MNYPNGQKTYISTSIKNSSRRGMTFEDDINKSNLYYLHNDLAVVFKKPTPITIAKVDYPKRSAAKITEAYFKLPSTTDYNGLYRGHYLDFEAKECHNKRVFPFSSIHVHQIEHLRRIVNHGGIAFILLRMNLYNKDYLVPAVKFLHFYDGKSRKSLPYEWIKKEGFEITNSYQIPVNYLAVVNKYFFKGVI